MHDARGLHDENAEHYGSNGYDLNHALSNGDVSARDVGGKMRHPVWSGDSRETISVEAQQLVERGHVAMYEGRLDEGEQLFRKALQYEHLPAVVNNLALLQLERHNQPDAALRLLQRNLDAPTQPWQPFTKALVSRCLSRLNRRDNARRALEHAIADFEDGMAAKAGAPAEDLEAWREYTTKILEAAGELGDDRKTWNLYEQWAHHHVLASSHMMGGIAAFNLQRFASAGEAWRTARKLRHGIAEAYEAVANWCALSLIEPFPLQYEFRPPDSPIHLFMDLAEEVPGQGVEGGNVGGMMVNSEDGELRDGEMMAESAALMKGVLIEYLRRPANRVFLIWAALRAYLPSDAELEGSESNLEGVRRLFAAGGDWAEASARRLFVATVVDPAAKAATAEGLLRAGRLDPDGSVRLWLNGALRDVPIVGGKVRLTAERGD